MTIRGSTDSRIPELIRQASRIADQVIHRSFADAYLLKLTFVVTHEGRSFPLISAIDRALEVTPNDPDVLFAKAEAYSLLRDDETGQRLRRDVLRLAPDHFDAYMREHHFQHWENMFTYPGWGEDFMELPPVMLAVYAHGDPVQIVRDGLTLTLVVLVQESRDSFPRNMVDARWKPFWVETPYGPIFVHYAMFRVPDGGIYRREFSISPYPIERIHQRNGNWLIRRFCKVDSVFLVVNDGNHVIFNSRFVYSESVRSTLILAEEKLERVTLPADHDVRVQRAMEWYMKNSDIDEISY